MKILITGGHVTPAVAIIDRLLPKHTIVFVGRKYALEHEQTLSFEYRQISSRAIRFVNLRAGRINRLISGRSLLSLLQIPWGFISAIHILRNEKPDIVLSFGSYLALPIAVCAFFLQIPVYTHEQTVVPGISNRIIGFLSKKVFVSFKETADFFSKNKVVVAGNPIRKSIFEIKKKRFVIKKDRPVILFAGGSLGSHSVNVHVFNILSYILKTCIVIHQTGDTREYDDYAKADKLKKSLSKQESPHYFFDKHFVDDELGYIYSLTDLFVGRAGANTFFELVALKIPALFIPLPWAAHKEQEKQAKLFQEVGAGEIFYQTGNSEELFSQIKRMLTSIEKYKINISKLESLYNKDAAEIVIREIQA